MKKHCPFCHADVFFLFYPLHIAEHTKLLPDGQHKDHYTTPPERMYAGSLEGIPQIYYHPKCGSITQMPEEIIRSYLSNPFLYNGFTFCCGCHEYVPENELFWTETQENLADYMKGLKQIHNAISD